MTEPADQTETLAGAGGAAGTSPTTTGTLRLGGRYALVERIASGGMASVWRAHDEVLARTVAVKVLHDHLAADEDFRERFRREAIAAAKLTHPNVVSLYDTGTDDGRVYLVMEFVEGRTLKDVIADRGWLEPGQAAAIAERVARALDYAHERGLVHRDVKPANILIGDDGAVKVADFGIAKAEEAEADLTKTGMVLGTAAYVAPEQITGSAAIDGRADQYALGCMLYEALTGRQPFKGDSAVATAAQRLQADPPPLGSLRADLPRGLEAVVMRTLARRPADRFASAGQLADALAAFSDADTAQTAALAAPADDDTQAWDRGDPAPGGGARRRQGAGPFRPARFVPAVVALVLLAGAVVGFALASGQLQAPLPGRADPADGDGGGGDRQGRSDAATFDIAEGSSFDPQGDRAEKEELVPALFDGDPSTTWRTDTYSTAEFGGLKDGVGFWVDLGQRQQVAAAELQSPMAGLNYDVLVADNPADELDGWTKVGEQRDAGQRGVVTLDEPAQARYVLVWVVAPLPGPNRAEFGEITVLGE